MPRAMNGLLAVYGVVEKIIIVALLLVLMVIVLWVTGLFSFEMIGMIVRRMTGGGTIAAGAVSDVFSRMSMLHDVFGGFLLILIGVELMKTIAMYLTSHKMHVEVVFTVAIIAIARHAIDLDLRHLEAMELMGLGALLIALSVGYYFFRKASTLPFHDPTDAKP